MTTREAFMEADLETRIRGQIINDVYSHATIGEPFAVRHSLGVIPTSVSWLPYADCRVWATEADEALWTEDRVFLRCNLDSVRLRITVQYALNAQGE